MWCAQNVHRLLNPASGQCLTPRRDNSLETFVTVEVCSDDVRVQLFSMVSYVLSMLIFALSVGMVNWSLVDTLFGAVVGSLEVVEYAHLISWLC